MMKKFIIFLLIIFSINSISAMPIYLKPLSASSLQPNTNFDYEFNFTINSDCTNVVLSNSSTILTDNYGIGFIDINISNLVSVPGYLCEYRNGILRKTHTLSDQTFGNIFVNNIKSNSWVNISITESQISNLGSYLLTNGSRALTNDWNAGSNKITSDDFSIDTDNGMFCFGAGEDSCIYYDGTDTIWDPMSVGSGDLELRGGFRIGDGQPIQIKTSFKHSSDDLIISDVGDLSGDDIIIQDYDLTLKEGNLELGDNSDPLDIKYTNITMYSPNGSRFYCGVNNSGDWGCTG